MKNKLLLLFALSIALLLFTGAVLKIRHVAGGSTIMTIAMLTIVGAVLILLYKQLFGKRSL